MGHACQRRCSLHVGFLLFLNAAGIYKYPESVLLNDSDDEESENLETIPGPTAQSPTIRDISSEDDNDDDIVDEGQLDARVELAKVPRTLASQSFN
jgi:hypothetical protein